MSDQTSEPMSDERLAEIRAQLQQIARAPWLATAQGDAVQVWADDGDRVAVVEGMQATADPARVADARVTARFIAAAPATIAALLDEVERLRAREAREAQMREIVAAVAAGSWWSEPLDQSTRQSVAPGKDYDAIVYSAVDILPVVSQARALLAGETSEGTATMGAETVVNRRVVCLCGSTRFNQAFHDANLRNTLAGHIVLSIGCDMRSDADLFAHMSLEEIAEVKARLDALHLDKIAMADEVLILNVDGYIGESTSREIAHAQRLGKPVFYLEGSGDDAS